MRRALGLLRSAALAALHVTVLLVLVGLVLLLALSAGFERARVRSYLEAALGKAIERPGGGGPRLRIGVLEGPLYPYLVLRDVTLSEDATSPLRIAAVHVHLDLRSLLEKLVVIDELRIEGLEALLERDPAGYWTWQHWGLGLGSTTGTSEASAGWPARPVAIEVRRISVEGARIAIQSEQGGVPTRIVARANLSARDLLLPRGVPPPWPRLADLELSFERGVVAGRALDAAELALHLEGTQLRLGPARLESRFGSAQIEGQTDLAGWLDPGRGGSFALGASVESFDPSVLLARPELAGRVSGRLKLEGVHAAATPPRESVFRAEVTLLRSQLGPVRIQSAELRGSYDAGRWELAAGTLDAAGIQLRANGRGDLQECQRLQFDASAGNLAQLADLFGFESGTLAGTASLSGKLSGPYESPRGQLHVAASHLRVRGTDLGELRAEIAALGDGRIRINPLLLESRAWHVVNDGPLALHLEDSGVAIEKARLRLPGLGRASAVGRIESQALRGLRVELTGVAIDALAPLLPQHLATELAGTLSVLLAADGPLLRPTVTGHATWSRPRIDRFQADELSIDLTAAPPQLQAFARILSNGRDLLTGELSASYESAFDPLQIFQQPTSRLLLHAADLDLAIAAPWLPSLVRGVSGSAAFDVELRGGLLEPEISGQLTVASATFDVPTLGQKLGPLEAKIRLEDHAVRIDTVSLVGGHGAAKLSGMLALAGTTPVAADLTLDFLGFEVPQPQDLTGQLDGSLRIEGPLDGIGVRGTVVLNDGRIRLTNQGNPLVREIRVTQMQNAPTTSIREGEPAKLDLFDNATLDVRLQVPRNTWIVGQGAHVEIEGVIEAHKRPGQPVLALGGLDVVQGNYRLQGRMFQIEQGHALFSGRTDFDPVLDALATTRVNDVKILATVGGTASAPTLRLESDPPHTQNDVLALLLFGRTSDSLAQPEASGLSSFAAAAAGSALLNQIGGAAGPHLPVDTFTVGTADQTSGTTIGAGRYVTQDVYVHYDHDIGGSSGGRIRVDWRLTKQFSVESRTSSDGNASADLIWTYDY